MERFPVLSGLECTYTHSSDNAGLVNEFGVIVSFIDLDHYVRCGPVLKTRVHCWGKNIPDFREKSLKRRLLTFKDYSHGTSAHAQKGRGLHEEVLKMLNCGTVCQFGSIFHMKFDIF